MEEVALPWACLAMTAATRRPGGGCSSRRASQLHVQEVREAIAAVSNPPACGIQCWGELEWADSNMIPLSGFSVSNAQGSASVLFQLAASGGVQRASHHWPLRLTVEISYSGPPCFALAGTNWLGESLFGGRVAISSEPTKNPPNPFI